MESAMSEEPRRGGILRAVSSLSTSWGSAVSSPSVVQDESLAEIDPRTFSAPYRPSPESSFCQKRATTSGHYLFSLDAVESLEPLVMLVTFLSEISGDVQTPKTPTS